MTTDLLRAFLADSGTGWAFGTFGAIGEFMRDPGEPFTMAADGLAVATARGAIRLDPTPDLRIVAYESATGNGWSQGLALCLPEAGCAMSRRSAFTEIGPDAEALRPEDRGHILFDLGLACRQLDVLIRVRPEDAPSLRPHLGKPVFVEQSPALGAILPLQPPRIFIGRGGRCEIFQPIPPPDGQSPEGPHTHILPHLMKGGRTHAATTPIPEGLVPFAHAFPPHPAKDMNGRPRPFDREAYERFQTLLARYGAPDLVALKRRLIDAPPEALAVIAGSASGRHARLATRATLAQLAMLRPDDEVVRALLKESPDSPEH